MRHSYMIQGGTVVDGTGSAPFTADIRVVNGLIAEVGLDLKTNPNERLFSAEGCYVTPGFVETHNHFDAPMWWMPMLEPMAAYGVTTSINGNCGFSAAPCSADPEARLEMVKIFSFFEDIPLEPFLDMLPWDWTKWSEYRASLEKNLQLPVNFATFCGHVALRVAVLGKEAWDRQSTPAEIATMCALLEDALAAGALGLSSNLLDWDQLGRPIPTITASDAEWEALLDVVERYPGKTVEVIIGVAIRQTGVEDLARLERLVGNRKIRVQWAGLPPKRSQSKLLPLYDYHERYKAEGKDFTTTFNLQPLASSLTFRKTLIFGQTGVLVWHEFIDAGTDEEKLGLLRNPEWLARARESFDNGYPGAQAREPERLILAISETGLGPLGITLAEYMQRAGIDHPSDALAAWVLANGLDSSIMIDMPPTRTPEEAAEMMADDNAITNITDAGAHGQMLCGIGNNVMVMTRLVRDLKLCPIELVVYNLTGKLTNFFGLTDRGEIKVGKAADIAVFNLDEIEQRPLEKVYDVPNGKGGRTWRFTRGAAPMRMTMVNGVPTYVNGNYTGAFPGQFISPETPMQLAEAAE